MDENLRTRLLEAVTQVRLKIDEHPLEATLDDILLKDFGELREAKDKARYISYDALLTILDSGGSMTNNARSKFKSAYDYAKEYHSVHWRKKEDVPFFYHIERILLMMAVFGINKDNDELLPVLALHDVFDNPRDLTIWDTPTANREILEKDIGSSFGNNILHSVLAMSDREKADYLIEKRAVKTDQIKVMLETGGYCHWIGHILDRIDNLRDAKEAYSYATRRMKLEETWSVYLPVAFALSPVLGNIMFGQLNQFLDEYRPELLFKEELLKKPFPPHEFDWGNSVIENRIYVPPYTEVERKIIEKGDTPRGKSIQKTAQYTSDSLMSQLEDARRKTFFYTTVNKLPRLNELNANRALSYVERSYLLFNSESFGCLEERFDTKTLKKAASIPPYSIPKLFENIKANLSPALEKGQTLILDDKSGVYRLGDDTLVYVITVGINETYPKTEKIVLESLEEQVYLNKGYRVFYETRQLQLGKNEIEKQHSWERMDQSSIQTRLEREINGKKDTYNALYFLPGIEESIDFTRNAGFLLLRFEFLNPFAELNTHLFRYPVSLKTTSRV